MLNARCKHTNIHTVLHTYTHRHTRVQCKTTYTHTGGLTLHKPHSCAHDACCCCAYFPAIGPDPDTACQCTSLHEPQAARVEEETDGYQLFGGEPWVHSYCITTHTHTHMHGRSHWSCLTAILVPVFIGRAFTGNISLVICYSCSKPERSTNLQKSLKRTSRNMLQSNYILFLNSILTYSVLRLGFLELRGPSEWTNIHVC